MYYARIIVNDLINEGNFTKSFLLKIRKLGAIITVFMTDKSFLDLENQEDFDYFKNL